MKWSNIKLIFLRETKDQLRDRRTLFTIAVLPLLLYPLLGMTFMQISQFMREHPTRIWVVGSAFLPNEPPLITEDRFATDFASDRDNDLLDLDVDPYPPVDLLTSLEEEAQRRIRSGEIDAALIFQPDFGDRLDEFRASMAESIRAGKEEAAEDRPAPDTEAQENRDERKPPTPDELNAEEERLAELAKSGKRVPGPEVFYNTADDKSRIAFNRVNTVLRGWRESLVRRNLTESAVPPEATDPFELVNTDVAEIGSRRAAAWSKILPFIVLVWALTGAFYPAVDLCAGEKERGTLETLLSSPAKRSEIVWGKLLTVMGFSMATAVLNLISMGCTGLIIFRQLSIAAGSAEALDIGPPPVSALFWLLPALVPISALFSALALAIAAFARSSKEGQYYLLPLLMITLPLIMLPMLPAAELDLGTSLIPVSGLMMLLRALIEGQYSQALIYLPTVSIVTGLCCLFAVRWAVEQFRNESVLFRENERFGVGVWVRHLVRDRTDTPSFAEAIACGVLLLMIRFFAGMLATTPTVWSEFVVTVLITQVALIATPPLMMACFLTKSPAKSLLLRWPVWKAIPAAILLAACLHPSVLWLSEWIKMLYPISGETIAQLKPITDLMTQAPLLHVVLLMALAPAVCEELAFRGFILSGLRHAGHKWAAIAISSLFFALAHGLLQQSLSAFVVGAIIGYIAVQTGSLLPAIAFHFTHNALAICVSRVPVEWAENNAWTRFALQISEGGILYDWKLSLVLTGCAVGLLYWFKNQPYQRYEEESLMEELAHEKTEPISETKEQFPANA